MYELEENEYSKVKKFLNNIADEIVFPHSVIEKRQKGRVFVDDVNSPNVTLICHYSGFGYLSGSTEICDFNNDLIEVLYKRSEINIERLRIIVSSDHWQNKIKKLLDDKIIFYSDLETQLNYEKNQIIQKLNTLSSNNIIAWQRVKFKLNKELFSKIFMPNKLLIPNGFALKKIDDYLIKKIKGNIIPSYSWHSDESFLKDGVGFCLVTDGNIISSSFSAFVSNDKIDIGIETNLDYRGKGFGLITGAAMVKYCLDNGFDPVWCCRKDNVGSFLLAKKLCFEEMYYLPLYCAVK